MFKKINIYHLLILVLAISDFFFYPRINVFGVNIRTIDVLALLSFLFSLLEYKRNYRIMLELKKELNLFYFICFLIFLSLFFSAIFSDFKLIAFKKTIQAFENIWLIFFSFLYFKKTDFKLFFSFLFFFCVFQGILSILFQYFPNSGDIYMGDLVRISGLSWGYFATHILSVSVFLLLYYIHSENWLVLLLPLSFLFSIIILIQIRSVWFLLFILFLLSSFFAFRSNKINKMIYISITTFLMLSFLFFTKDIFASKTIPPFEYKSNSFLWKKTLSDRHMNTLNIRLGLWKTSFNIFSDHILFGSGPGTFGKLYKIYSNNRDVEKYNDYRLSDEIDAHSQFFTRIAELGFIGFFSYGLLFAFLIYRAWNFLLETNAWYSNAFFVFFILSLFSDFVSDTLGLKLFYIFSGIFISFLSKDRYEY